MTKKWDFDIQNAKYFINVEVMNNAHLIRSKRIDFTMELKGTACTACKW